MKDKVVIITGSTSGIGKALAVRFASAGSKVMINGRDAAKVSGLVNELSGKGLQVAGYAADVSNIVEADSLIKNTRNRFGTIDILINNAGISMRALFEDMDLEAFRKVIDINFWGTVFTTKYALGDLISNEGSVVGISSVAGKKGLPGRTGYSASKFAMEGFLEALRLENRNKNLHVLIACPGFTASNIRNTALDKDGKPQKESPRNEAKMMSSEDVADRIYEAIDKRKRDLVLTTQGKLAVILNKFLPSLADKLTFDHMSKEPGSPF